MALCALATKNRIQEARAVAPWGSTWGEPLAHVQPDTDQDPQLVVVKERRL